MIYLIESDNLIVINKKIDDILSKYKLSKENIIKYDLLETPIGVLINELNTYNLLVDRKVVVGENAVFLTSSKVKGVEHNIDVLESYINNLNPDNILILVCNKVDNKKKIVKLLKDKGDYINGEVDITSIIKSHLDGYKMDIKTINYLIDYCGGDDCKILNELEKLKSYKLDNKEITIRDIDLVVSKSFDDNVFDFINAIVSKNRVKAYDIYNELLYKGEEVTKLVIMVADQIRLIYNCKVLLSDGYRKDDIASYLGVHPYKIKLAINSSYSYSENDLLKLLDKLYKIDLSIKTGKTSNNILFEMFILDL